MKIVVSNVLRVKGAPEGIERAARRDLALKNPEYALRERMGKRLGDIEEFLTLAEWVGDDLVLPRGYLQQLRKHAADAGVHCEIDDRRLKLSPEDFTFHGTLRLYQQAALERMTKHGSGILVAPCGSGKTAMGMALIAHWKQPTLFLVHTIDLLKQAQEAARQWLHVEPGIIGGGTWEPGPLTIATVQSLAAREADTLGIIDQFGLVITDECQHQPCSTFTETVQAFPAAFRFGLTATPDRADGLTPFMLAVLGPVRHRVTTDDLKTAGVLVEPHIEWIATDYRAARAFEWVDLIGDITANEERNALIVSTILRALDDGRTILVLSERVKHAEALASEIERRKPGLTALATGTLAKKKREEEFERVRNGEARALFSTKIADEGLDLPALDALMLTTPARDAAKTMQRAGRVLRFLPGKQQPVIFDFVDIHVGQLANQARTRFFNCYRQIAPDQRLPEWLDRKKAA